HRCSCGCNGAGGPCRAGWGTSPHRSSFRCAHGRAPDAAAPWPFCSLPCDPCCPGAGGAVTPAGCAWASAVPSSAPRRAASRRPRRYRLCLPARRRIRPPREISCFRTPDQYYLWRMSESTSALDSAQLHAELDTIFDEVLNDLTDLVAIPSVAWPSFDASRVTASAEAVAALAEGLGLEVEILTAEQPDGTNGYPAVVASIPAPEGAPTVLLYAHHDVQPPGREEDWETDPFVATRQGDRLFGRGAADDKAGIMVHLTALRLLSDRLAVGVTLFFEGEEEAGSPSFRSFLETYRQRLRSDVIVVADSGNWAAGTPALTTSLRGMCAVEFEIATLDHAVHSGMYGGLAPDAMLAMTKVLASLHDENGSVAVPGLHRELGTDIDYDEATLRGDSGVLESTELIGSGTLASRLWTQPAITVIGLDIPDVAVSSNTLQSSLKAKLSIRLAPGDTPASAVRAVEEHLRANLPFGAQLRIGETE